MSDLLNIQIPLKTVMLPQNSLLYTLNVHIECEQTCVTTDQSHIIIHLGPVEIGGGAIALPSGFAWVKCKTCSIKRLCITDFPTRFLDLPSALSYISRSVLFPLKTSRYPKTIKLFFLKLCFYWKHFCHCIGMLVPLTKKLFN